MAVSVANATIAAIIQPAVAATFDLGAAEVGWIVFGYTATFAVSTVIYAATASRVGVGRALSFGIILFSIAAVLMAVSTSFEQLLVLRILQGAGAGAIPTLTTTLAASRWSGPGRIRAMGILVAGVGIGQAAGPISVGILLELASWQAALLIGAIGAPIAVLALKTDPGPGISKARPDIVGMLLLALMAGATVLFLNRLPVSGLEVAVLASGLVAVIALVGFGLRVTRRDDSIFPPGLRRDRRFLGTLVIAACSMTAFMGMVVVMPIGIAAAGGPTGLALGLVYLPMAIAVAGFSMTTARSQARLGRWGAVRLGLICQSAGVILLAVVGAAAPLWLLGLLMGINGIGMGISNAPQINDVAERFDLTLRPRALGLWHLCFFLAGGASAALATGMIGAGWELPFLAGSAVPGFSSALLLMGLVALLPVFLRGPSWTDARRPQPAASGGI
jgi:MFS family permease